MAGGYTHNVLSNNTADLESYLFGIGTSNLVTPFQKPAPNLNNLDNEKFFDKPGYCMPNPLIIEKDKDQLVHFLNLFCLFLHKNKIKIKYI